MANPQSTSSLSLVQTKKQRVDRIIAQMEQESSGHRAYWREILDYFAPMRARFSLSETNRLTRKNQRIINSRAIEDLDILKAGMMTTITNPAVNWVKMSVEDKELAEFGPVKDWLGTVNRLMNDVFLKSNLYRTLPTVYGDMGLVAMGAMLQEEDLEDVVRFYSLPIGSYMISTNSKGQVDTFARQISFTVRQLVEKFGVPQGLPVTDENIDWDRFSTKVRNFWDSGQGEVRVDTVHLIYRNEDYDPTKFEAKFKKFASVYFERTAGSAVGDVNSSNGSLNGPDKFLSESGFDIFPVMVPRWETTGNDAYGSDCPAMKSYGDQRSLQNMERRKAQALEHKVNPAKAWPSSLRKKKNSSYPGDNVYLSPEEMAAGGVRALYEIDFDIREFQGDIQDHMNRIDAQFNRPAFKAISDLEGTDRTAFEINARLQEARALMAGTVVNVQDDLLKRLVDNTFFFMNQQGLIPLPPQEISGQELKVEFIGVLAQSQKSIALGGLRDFTAYLNELVSLTQDPSVLNKANINQMIDEFAEGSGVSTDIVRSDEEVEAIEAAEAELAAQQQAQEAMLNLADSAKTLSETNLDGDTALNALTEGAAEEAPV